MGVVVYCERGLKGKEDKREPERERERGGEKVVGRDSV